MTDRFHLSLSVYAFQRKKFVEISEAFLFFEFL